MSDATPPAARAVILRLSGEVAIKARPTRRQFVTRLVRNLKDALRSEGIAPRVERSHDRLLTWVERPEQVAALQRVFGVQSLSLVERRPWRSLDDVVAAGVAIAAERVRGRRFAVRARRVGDRARIPLGSRDVEHALGAALLPGAARVDLSSPEVTVHVELRPGEAHFFAERLPGPGGLPLGCEGRAVALVSGGFDSVVAAWQMARRGVAQDFVFCNLGGAAHRLGTLRVVKRLTDRWLHGQRPRFHAMDFDPLSRDLQARTGQRYWQVILKRLMLRAAAVVASETGGLAVVTGEAVGQVSSQTLANLAVITEATSLPVLRPLVGANKDEIVALARHIGTFELSSVVGEYCAMVPRRPATAATLAAVRAEEERMDPSLLERAVAERAVLDLRRLDVDQQSDPSLEVGEIPPDAVVLDLRTKAAYEAWHWPDALFLDFADALRAWLHFDRSRRYVLYCEFGLKSAHLAELMRRGGLDARHVGGGAPRLQGRRERA